AAAAVKPADTYQAATVKPAAASVTPTKKKCVKKPAATSTPAAAAVKPSAYRRRNRW
ncbi:hypothetical protein HK102_005298, partial [Quaeritorhiza haematococci]